MANEKPDEQEARSREAYSLWLGVREADSAAWRNAIKSLIDVSNREEAGRALNDPVLSSGGGRVSAPEFEPHVTLLGSPRCEPELSDARARLSAAAARVMERHPNLFPMELEVEEFRLGQTFFTAFHASLIVPPLLHSAFKEALAAACGPTEQTRSFQPHLSLLYHNDAKTFPAEKIAAALSASIAPVTSVRRRCMAGEERDTSPVKDEVNGVVKNAMSFRPQSKLTVVVDRIDLMFTPLGAIDEWHVVQSYQSGGC